MLPMFALPDTLRDVNVPTDVIFGCADVVSTPVNKLALITSAPIILPPEPEPKFKLPVILALPVAEIIPVLILPILALAVTVSVPV